MKNLRSVALAAAASLLLSACVYPIQFNATVKIESDGRHAAKVKGDFRDFGALQALIKNRGITSTQKINVPHDKQYQAQMLKEYSKLGFTNVKFIDPITVKAVFQEQPHEVGKNKGYGKELYRITKTPSNTYVFVAKSTSREEAQHYLGMEQDVKGVLEVVLPKNAVVLQHNATSKPGFFGGTYKWTYSANTQEPMLEFALK